MSNRQGGQRCRGTRTPRDRRGGTGQHSLLLPVGTWPYPAFPPGTPFGSGSRRGEARFGLGPSGQTAGPVPHHQQLGQGAAGKGLGRGVSGVLENGICQAEDQQHFPSEETACGRGQRCRGHGSNSVHRRHLRSELSHGPVPPRGSGGQAGVGPRRLHFSQRPGEVNTASQTPLFGKGLRHSAPCVSCQPCVTEN